MLRAWVGCETSGPPAAIGSDFLQRRSDLALGRISLSLGSVDDGDGRSPHLLDERVGLFATHLPGLGPPKDPTHPIQGADSPEEPVDDPPNSLGSRGIARWIQRQSAHRPDFAHLASTSVGARHLGLILLLGPKVAGRISLVFYDRLRRRIGGRNAMGPEVVEKIPGALPDLT
jgi:hypothetical protein